MKTTAVALVLVATAGPAAAEWRAWSSTDEMSGAVRKGVVSAWTKPTRAMSFPYADARGVAGLACDGRGAYFRFSSPPNVSQDDTEDGYNVSRLRVRFDATPPTRIGFTQVWGSNQLTTNDAAVRKGILSAKEMLLEIPWHGQGNVVFRFDLAGSAAAYRAGCPERIARDAKEAEKRAAQIRAAAKARAEAEKRAAKEAEKRAAREREAEQARAEREAAVQEARQERVRKLDPFGKDWEKSRRHVEASGWSCPNVESVGLVGTWYAEVACSGGMKYLIRHDGSVDELRRSGRRL